MKRQRFSVRATTMAVNAGGDPNLGNYRPPDFALPPELSLTRLEDRRKLLDNFDRWKSQTEASSDYAALADVQREAFQLVTSQQARQAFDLTREPDRLKDQYGRHAWGQSALLARRLVEAGVTFVNINFYEKDVDWWDDQIRIIDVALLPEYRGRGAGTQLLEQILTKGRQLNLPGMPILAHSSLSRS